MQRKEELKQKGGEMKFYLFGKAKDVFAELDMMVWLESKLCQVLVTLKVVPWVNIQN